MKKFNTLLLAVISMCSYQLTFAQQSGTLCDGNKGPNLLGARGTFSAPFIKPNVNADPCLHNGSNTYSPIGNVGLPLEGCSSPSGNVFPCSDYNYTAKRDGMQPEFTYSLLKVMGDKNGSNCIHSPIWKGADHTGDGGYFMAVNGDANHTNPNFYQIKSIPVCIGATYEFSAYVMNMMPSSEVMDTWPDVYFVVNGDTIGRSGKIKPEIGWVKVGGSFVATTSLVDLRVVNATTAANGNDLGLDDISINVCESRIEVKGPNTSITPNCEGATINVDFSVSDPSTSYKFYKWMVSRDGSLTWSNDGGGGSDLQYDANGKAILRKELSNISFNPNETNVAGNIYRLIVATSKAGLNDPDCIFFNDYVLTVASCGPLPVKLSSFDGSYSNGVATLNWQTSQELNSDHFDLFRSLNGTDFDLAGTVKGAGNSLTAKRYQFKDNVAGGEGSYVYYKLKQVDVDGKFTFSDVIKLSLGTSKADFTLYPNPFVNDFTASFSATKSGTATLVIRNINGQTVHSKTINVLKGNNKVQTSISLKAGMYYVTISNEEFNYSGKLQKL